jgi:hypothetical protein
MVAKRNFLITVVISAAVAALILVYSAPTQAGSPSHVGGKTGGSPNIGGSSSTQPQAGTGSVTTHNPGGGTTTTTVISNWDGNHGEKVITVTKDANGNTTSSTGTTYDANGKQTDTATCKGSGC